MKYYIGNIPYGNDLTHFGIKGMHWGVRRFQNPDGTLTAAGKVRYAENTSKRQLANEIKTAKKNGSLKTFNAVYSKATNELKSTKEYKQFKNVEEFINQQMTSTIRQMPSNQVNKVRQINVSGDVAELYAKFRNDVSVKAREILGSHRDEFASAVLKDLGYEDTEAGRSRLKKMKVV